LTEVKVRPAVVDGQGKTVDTVTFRVLEREASPARWAAPGVYQVIFARPPYADQPAGSSIRDYLTSVQGRAPSIQFSYQAWREPRAIWAMCLGGSVFLIGMIWPMLIRLMVKIGLVAPLAKVDPGYDLSRAPRKRTASVPLAPTADRAELDLLNAQLEAKVADMLMTDSVSQDVSQDADVTPARPAQPGIRPLDAPVAQAPTTPAPQPGDRDYAGEYYPVARTGAGKKD